MRKIYFTSSALHATATITKIEPVTGGVWLDQTIFVPQGGGQKSDTGSLGRASVHRVSYSDDGKDVVHFVDCAESLHVDDCVALRVDAEPRVLHSRLHSAGHLIAGVVEAVLSGTKARSGHHWPGESRVEFTCPAADLPSGLDSCLNAHLRDAIDANLPIVCTDDLESPRTVQIQGFAALECGGSHVGKLGEIGGVVVRNVRLKKGVLRVGYDVVSANVSSTVAGD